MSFEPTFESVKQHQMQQWFDDAKLGIFVHWGLYAVPGWATKEVDFEKVVAEGGWETWFAHNSYAEWYLNTLRIGNTPTNHYHAETYGENFSYDDFASIFNQAVEKWNPDEWASLFQKIGARYVVLTTKHHDGFLLWNSPSTSPHKPEPYAAQRDLVGELTEAVRRHNMHMGLYYSGGLDWSFDEKAITNHLDVFGTIVQSPEFVEYVTNHWHELIDRYAPSILWNDIGYPTAADVPALFAYYYNTVAGGLVNDRFRQHLPDQTGGADDLSAREHYDFTTPEYASYKQIVERKWESTRGIGRSFGYNQNEGSEDYLSVEELVRSFVDIVSKNGNLLLDVGPMADGTIPELQRERLLGFGAWLDVNGDAIFATRPWVTAEGTTSEAIPVRFTQKDGALYALLLETPHTAQITLEKLCANENTTITLLGGQGALDWTQQGNNLVVTLPALADAPSHVLKINPVPQLAQ